jgi:hypothetical protein
LEGGLKKTEYKEGEIIERTRNIFYDTDGIRENQHEKVRYCRDCAGALAIESRATTGQHIFAVNIPMRACSNCRQIGRSWFEKASRGSFDHTYLQDRVQGVYERT